MSTTVAPRVPSGRFRELGPVNWVVCRIAARVVGTPDVHLFSTLGRTGGLFRGWLRYSGKLMGGLGDKSISGGTLPAHDRELVILRVAHLRHSDYEWDHHSRIGRRVEITERILECITQGPTAESWHDRHRALLTAVDQIVTTKTVDDDAWTALAVHYDPRRLIEIILLTTQYDGLATTIAALGIPGDFT